MSAVISPNSSLLFLNPSSSSNSNSKSHRRTQSLSFYNPFNFSPSITSLNYSQFTPIPKTLTLTQPPKTRVSAAASEAAEPETLKTRLKNGETLYGLFLCSFSPTLAEIAGLAGYDFVVVDMEHGYGGIPEALTCLRSLAATGTPGILRLPESTAAWAKKALDLGPQGIMFPMIESPKEAQKAVSYCRYPPNGVRGAAHSIVRASGYGIDAGYLGHCEEELLIMCQVECEEAIEKVEKIAAVEGVDCIQMGPLDLSASMGYLWDPGNKKVREKMRKAEKEVLEGKMGNEKNGGAYLAGFAMPHDSPQELKSRGYHMVSGAVDILLFRSAAVEDVKKFKISLEIGDGSSDDDDLTAEGKDADYKYWRLPSEFCPLNNLVVSMATSVSLSIPSLKSRLRKGDCLYGLFFDSFSPTIAAISGHAGYDFVVIDMEHGYGGISEALSCLNALAASQTPAILRLPECSAMWAKKALDLGPQGLMFPMIHTPELAQEAVSYCRYPRAGIRGVAHPIARASKYGLDPTYLDWCEEELLIMCQVESEEAVHKIQEITAIDGMDCIMIGPTDLSANMGYIRDPGNENAVKMVQTVENAVLGMKAKGDKRVYLAGFAMPHDEASELKKRGYDMVCGAVDILLYRDAAVKDVLKFKTAV